MKERKKGKNRYGKLNRGRKEDLYTLQITSEKEQQEKQNKIKRMKRAEDSLRDLWDNIKCTNIQIIGVPEEEEKKKKV